MKTRWLKGRYFDLLIYPDIDYGGYISHSFDIYVKDHRGRRHETHGRSGDITAEDWLKANDTLQKQRFYLNLWELSWHKRLRKAIKWRLWALLNQ